MADPSKGVTAFAPGGGVYFASVAAKHLGLRANVITKCARADRHMFDVLQQAGVGVKFIDSPASTSCQNEYPSDNPDDRHVSQGRRAPPVLFPPPLQASGHEVARCAILAS